MGLKRTVATSLPPRAIVPVPPLTVKSVGQENPVTVSEPVLFKSLRIVMVLDTLLPRDTFPKSRSASTHMIMLAAAGFATTNNVAHTTIMALN